MGNLGWPEILIILVIALIIFGPRKLPELGKSLGQSLAQFRKASEDFKRTWEQEVEVEKRKLEESVTPFDTTTRPSESAAFEPSVDSPLDHSETQAETVARVEGASDDAVKEAV